MGSADLTTSHEFLIPEEDNEHEVETKSHGKKQDPSRQEHAHREK
jgi:hypothetical protein